MMPRTTMKSNTAAMVLAGFAAIVGTSILSISGAGAQLTPITPGGGASDFKPLYVKPADLKEGERLAEMSCSGCHGPNGISITDGVPHLAGQRSVYQYVELKAYQVGRRAATVMGNAVRFLNDDALVKVAAYYASLDPAQPRGDVPPAKPDPYEAGKVAAESCGGCHGESGVSKIPGMPSLAGLDPKYLVTAMEAYKSGQRKHEVMKALIANVSDTNIRNIALFYALQKPGRAQTPAEGDVGAGKTASAACSGCHGDTGVSPAAVNPSLAGQDAQYLMSALDAYKNGARTDETMKGLVGGLDDKTKKDLAAFYHSQQPARPNVRKPLSTAEWAARCNRCHGLNGNSTDPHIPALAGQRMDYLDKVLRDYRTRERRSAEMAAMSDALSDDDIANLAAYYSRQNARAVIYVVVPSK
jgi:cytochrome c553